MGIAADLGDHPVRHFDPKAAHGFTQRTRHAVLSGSAEKVFGHVSRVSGTADVAPPTVLWMKADD
jgi:hypothetical protein